MVFFENIEFVGMFCLGAFVGGILNYGLSHIKDGQSFDKIVATIFGAAFSGVVFVFLEYLLNLKDRPGLDTSHVYMYPLGLIMALLWAQIPTTMTKYVNDENKLMSTLGVLHIIALSALTVFLTISFFVFRIK